MMADAKNPADLCEKQNIAYLAGSGALLKIYPYQGDWYSLADKLPADMAVDDWRFIRYSMDYVAEQVAMHNYAKAEELVGKIRKYQAKQCITLPTDAQFRAERWYNTTDFNRTVAMFCITFGFVLFLINYFKHDKYDNSIGRLECRHSINNKLDKLAKLPWAVLCIIFCYLTFRIALRTIVSGHLPLSSGFETMQFMAWCAVLASLFFAKRWPLVMPFGFLVVGFCMLVAMIGEKSPQITQLVPVLNSPLLSIHVAVIMVAYALLAFMMLNGVMGLILIATHRSPAKVEELRLMSQIILYPATFLLTIGIFIGAVWANQSWGRYWGWDPKETWALITMLVYSIGLHTTKMPWLRKPAIFHSFCSIAFIFVLITYIGVNFFMGGRHSYV